MKRVLGLVALSLFGLAACVVEPGSEENDYAAGDVDNDAVDNAGTAEGKAVMPIKGFAGPSGQAGTGANGINYNGGPVMTGTINVYLIWYGDFSYAPTTKSIIHDLASNIGGSPYMNINTTYTNSSGVAATKNVVLAGERDDNYSNGTTAAKKKLSDTVIQSTIGKHIGAGKFPADPNGIYFLITSKDVTASSGFCTQYCGWHTYGTLAGTANLKYSFLGDPERCPSSCEMYSTGTPNGNPGADGLASIFAHELEEAGSDPLLNAWYDSTGYENADKCAWTFGTVTNGANMTIGNRNYLIQRNWVNAGGGYCATSY